MGELSILQECMDIRASFVTDIATMAESMEPLDSDKQLIFLSDEDKTELATLILVKGGMSGLGKKAKEMEEKVKEVGAPWMLARDIKTVRVPGVGTLSLNEGKNASISQGTLRKVLIQYLPAETVAEVIRKSLKVTQYTTLQFKA